MVDVGPSEQAHGTCHISTAPECWLSPLISEGLDSSDRLQLFRAGAASQAWVLQHSPTCVITIDLATIPMQKGALHRCLRSVKQALRTRGDQGACLVLVQGSYDDTSMFYVLSVLEEASQHVHTLQLQCPRLSAELATAAAQAFPNVEHLLLGMTLHGVRLRRADLPPPSTFSKLTHLTLLDTELARQHKHFAKEISASIAPYVTHVTTLSLYGSQYHLPTIFTLATPTTTLTQLHMQYHSLDDSTCHLLLQHAPALRDITARNLQLNQSHTGAVCTWQRVRVWDSQEVHSLRHLPTPVAGKVTVEVFTPEEVPYCEELFTFAAKCSLMTLAMAVSPDQDVASVLLQRLRHDVAVTGFKKVNMKPLETLLVEDDTDAIRRYTPVLAVLCGTADTAPAQGTATTGVSADSTNAIASTTPAAPTPTTSTATAAVTPANSASTATTSGILLIVSGWRLVPATLMAIYTAAVQVKVGRLSFEGSLDLPAANTFPTTLPALSVALLILPEVPLTDNWMGLLLSHAPALQHLAVLKVSLTSDEHAARQCPWAKLTVGKDLSAQQLVGLPLPANGRKLTVECETLVCDVTQAQVAVGAVDRLLAQLECIHITDGEQLPMLQAVDLMTSITVAADQSTPEEQQPAVLRANLQLAARTAPPTHNRRHVVLEGWIFTPAVMRELKHLPQWTAPPSAAARSLSSQQPPSQMQRGSRQSLDQRSSATLLLCDSKVAASLEFDRITWPCHATEYAALVTFIPPCYTKWVYELNEESHNDLFTRSICNAACLQRSPDQPLTLMMQGEEELEWLGSVEESIRQWGAEEYVRLEYDRECVVGSDDSSEHCTESWYDSEEYDPVESAYEDSEQEEEWKREDEAAAAAAAAAALAGGGAEEDGEEEEGGGEEAGDGGGGGAGAAAVAAAGPGGAAAVAVVAAPGPPGGA